MIKSPNRLFASLVITVTTLFVSNCKTPDEQVVLKSIKDVVVDGTSEPRLKATALLYNPNPHRGKLKRINIDIFVNGKKAGVIDQKLSTAIPAKGDFSVPLEVKLATKELGFLNTVLSLVGGKKIKVHYKGSLKVTYHGLPIKVPIDYEDEVKIRL